MTSNNSNQKDTVIVVHQPSHAKGASPVPLVAQQPITNNKMSTYVWANGDRYEGEWSNGQPSGQGIYT